MQGRYSIIAIACSILAISVARPAQTDGVSDTDPVDTASAEATPRYTFSWPLHDGELAPRGGTTRGAPVDLDVERSKEWQDLQAPNLTALQRDRRAILAMAGEYRVTFDFLEIASFGESRQPQAPYQSWGTEKIYVDVDEERHISLVHILEMRLVQEDGAISAPMVTKHWRQDWHYEPKHIVEYRGLSRWERRTLDSPSRGAWLQTVYQVDESPRYASVGRWQHNGSFSTWMSDQTWRPLPRREWSVRDDYHALIGTNRHTIGPSGWLQEENNLKAVLTPARELAPLPYLGREYGVARYERLKNADFSAADRYYERTREFWRKVRQEWDAAFARESVITLRGPVDKLGLFVPLFQRADEIAQLPEEASQPAEDRAAIRGALENMGVPMPAVEP